MGAPLIHDCCLISLSDLMTPMEAIRKRLILAAEAGFIIVLYNPGSRTRRDYLKRACEWLMEELSPETVCGLARQIGREGGDADSSAIEVKGYGSGYVYHGIYRKCDDQRDKGEDGDAARICL